MRYAVLSRCCLGVALCGVLAGAARASDNVFVKDGKARNIWVKDGATLAVGGRGGLDISVPHGGKCNGIVYLKPEWKFVRLSMEMKADNLARGEKDWQCGRVVFIFRDAEHKHIGGWQKTFDAVGTTDYIRYVHDYAIPEGSVALSVDPSNYGAAGDVHFRDLKVIGFADRDELALAEDDGLPRLPPTSALWSLDGAHRGRSSVRERICLNSVWQFLPVKDFEDGVLPDENADWLYFKVPGIWGSSAEKQQNNAAQHIMRADGSPAAVSRQGLTRAWYRRTVEVPAGWQGKAIGLDIAYIQTAGKIYVNRRPAGEVRFPGGEIDIGEFVTPGEKAEILVALRAESDASLALFVAAPGRTVPSRKRGNDLCGVNGDVYLTARPAAGALLSDARIVSKVVDGRIEIDAGILRAAPGPHRLRAEILDGPATVKTFVSEAVDSPSPGARFRFGDAWTDAMVWDPENPRNLYTAKITLIDPGGGVADQLEPIEFGFREIAVQGRHLYLNGAKLHLRSTLVWTPIKGADHQTEETFATLAARLREYGLNHALGQNYGFAPGSGTFLDASYRGLSRHGVLFSVTFPRGALANSGAEDIDWSEYRRQAEYLIRRYQNLPGAILYAGNHNACGYMGDQNPARIDGVHTPDPDLRRFARKSFQLRELARQSEKIIREFDDSRPIYHHEGGNIGDVFTLNCYLNWAPRQERDDWFEYWENNGRMPLFLVEWGVPYSASYSSYRGPGFIFGVEDIQCLWLNEFDAAILGESAYRQNSNKTLLYRVQESRIAGNRPISFNKLHWFWDNLESQRSWAWYVGENLRSLRARGVSFAPWDPGTFWKGKAAEGTFAERFDNLKTPGPKPDAYQYSAHEVVNNPRDDAPVAREAGRIMKRDFAPRTGWIAGRIGDFSEKGHNFRPGETVEKSLLILNHGHAPARARWSWSAPALGLKESGEASIPAGERADIPLVMELSPELCRKLPREPSGNGTAARASFEIEAHFAFDNAPEAADRFRVDLVAVPSSKCSGPLALIDPEGSAKKLLDALGLAAADASVRIPEGTKILILGRGALDRLSYSLAQALEDGLKLLVLEQPASTLERLGLRADEYGLRELFPVAGGGLTADNPRDWRGKSTLLSHYLPIEGYENKDPRWRWNGFVVSRVWRAGNRGTVASTIPEKPSVGDFMPLLQGGFDLQYAPVMEFREGGAHIILSQLDLSGRDETDPEALVLLDKMLVRLDQAEAPAHVGSPRRRRAWHHGGDRSRALLRELKIKTEELAADSPLSPDDLVVVGPGPETDDPRLADFVRQGGGLLGIGLDAAAIEAIVPGQSKPERRKRFSTFAPGLEGVDAFAGVGNAELHFRKELELDFFPEESPGGVMLERVASGRGEAVFCQVAPWHFDADEFMYRTTRRRNHMLISRLAHNLGATSSSGFAARFVPAAPAAASGIDGWIDLAGGWRGVADAEKAGREKGYFKDDHQPGDDWRPVAVPGYFTHEVAELNGYTGHFWYRRGFDFDAASAAGAPEGELTLTLGAIDDESWVWLNGEFLGEVTVKSHPKSFWEFSREYKVNKDKLRPRGNTLTVLVNERGGGGGILGAPRLAWKPGYRLYVDVAVAEDNPYRYYRW